MSSDEMDAFRAELLRQRIIFEAELRRQRETFEEQLARVAEELADREADCRNLQAVVTILGKKVDSLAEKRASTPQRRSSSARPASSLANDSVARGRLQSPSAHRTSHLRQTVNSTVVTPRPAGAVLHAPSLSSVASRQESPARTVSNVNGQRAKIGQEDITEVHIRRVSTSRGRKRESLVE